MKRTKVRWLCLTTITLATACPAILSGQPAGRLDADETKEALALLRDRLRTNFQRVQTWNGIWNYKEQVVLRKVDDTQVWDLLKITSPCEQINQINEGSLSFFFDRPQNRLSVELGSAKPEFREVDSGAKVKVASAFIPWSIHIFTPTEYLHSQDVRFDDKGQPVERAGWLEPASAGEKLAGVAGFIHPVKLFSFDGMRPYWESLSSLLDHMDMLDDGKGAPATQPAGLRFWVECMRRNPPRLYRLVVTGPTRDDENAEILTQDLLFEEAAGFNVNLVIETRNGVKSGQQEVFYVQQEGVFLPQRHVRTYFDRQGLVRIKRELTLDRSKLNEPVPPEQFTFWNLGLRDGESFCDNAMNVAHIYSGGELHPQPADRDP